MITSKNIIKHELIGLPVKILKSTDKGKERLEGKVADESQNMLIIKTDTGFKKVQKEGTIFRFFFKEEAVDIDGDVLLSKPEERIKNKLEKW